MSQEWWHSEDLQRYLLTFLCRDRNFLKTVGGRLTADDFKPTLGESSERYVVAKLALPFWRKHKEPIGGMLRTEALEYAAKHTLSDKRKRKLLEFVSFIASTDKLPAVAAMEEKVAAYLESTAVRKAIDEIILLEEEKKLTSAVFTRICKNVAEWSFTGKLEAEDIISEQALNARISRRVLDVTKKRPFFMIHDLDVRIKNIGRGDLGLLLAPLKKGKSLGLAHLAVAYAKQKLNVLYVSLEDPKEEVEDRFDAAISGIAIDKLNKLPQKLRNRFKKYSKTILNRIRLVDGTAHEVKVSDLEETVDRLRDNGFIVDVIIVDYDEYIRPSEKKKSKIEEFQDIYIDYRKLLAKKDCIGWTAAQTKRVKDTTKIITQDMTGDDIGKTRKATLVLGIGQGETCEDARYIYVTAYKRDRQHFGIEIISSPHKGMFYDAERTERFAREKGRKTSDI